jgi:hypothetical protein
MRHVRRLLAFIAAVLTTAVLGAVASTQFVLAALAAVGAAIPLADRLSMTLQDVVGMLPLYGAVVAVGFVVAFPVAARVIRVLPQARLLGYALAGAVAVVASILVLAQLFGLTPIAGARSMLGLAVQGLAGAAGGAVFARWARRPHGAETPAAPAAADVDRSASAADPLR